VYAKETPVNPVPVPRPSWRRITSVLLSGLLLATFAAPAAAAPKLAPAAAAAATEYEIEARLQQLLDAALHLSADSQLQGLVRWVAARQLDDDTDALLATVIAEAETYGYVDPNESWWQQLKSDVGSFVVDDFQYDPQIHIPNLEDGNLSTEQISVVVRPADDSVDSLYGYWVDVNGTIRQTIDPIDETYAESHEVWVLSVNERAIDGGTQTTVAQPEPVATPAASSPRSSNFSILSMCNPTGIRNNRGAEYLIGWRVPDKRAFGGWLSGKTEMRLVVVGSGGSVIKNYFFGKVKRKNIPNWQNTDVFITTWDTAVWGQVMGYQWFEVDGGRTTTTEISVPLQGGGSIKTSVTTQERDDDGGSAAVLFNESTVDPYSTGKVEFKVCSQGGDGGTGIDNLACGATASASTTFGGYSAARATDCDADTSLGGAYSWANARTVFPPVTPQWLQADFGVNKTFRRVVVYTSDGYPMKDFDIQVWNGTTFVTVDLVRGNTALSVSRDVGPQTTRLVRILCRSGPDHQPGFVRINELEVYAA
jgi:hypothetical protein